MTDKKIKPIIKILEVDERESFIRIVLECNGERCEGLLLKSGKEKND